MRRIGLLALAAWGTACSEAPRPPNPELWTLFDVLAARGDQALALDAGLPGGIPPADLLAGDGSELAVRDAWAEGYAAAYVTTEVWANYDRVWLQPLYVPVTGWTGGIPQTLVDAEGWHPVFSVGPQSGFYSPFWQLVYFDVPSGTSTDAITSARQILDGGYPLHPAAGRVVSLVPANVTSLEPRTPAVGGVKAGKGWLDGTSISFLNFPAAPFDFDDDYVIEEVPLFHFLFSAEDGSIVDPDIPPVLGTGPLGSHTPPPVDANGKPTAKYSAYWRLYTVVAPSGARVFAPPSSPLYQTLTAAGVPVVSDDAAYPMVQPDAVGRVALDPGCFAVDPDPHDPTCVYLDSQEKIESLVNPGDIEATSITVTSPLVSLNSMAVTP